MTLSEIQDMNNRAEQLISEGHQDSASRVVSDTVKNLILNPFLIDENTELLVHYTTVDALFSMLSCPVQPNKQFALTTSAPTEELDKESNFIRMYDTYNCNDPLEGRFFLKSKPSRHHFPSRHPRLWDLLSHQSRLPAYVASFRAVSKIADVDDLVFWRTYGKDGQGCAIVFPASFLGSTTPVLRVKYGKRHVISTLKRLLCVFDSLESATSLEKVSNATTPIPRYVASSLSPIPYLHKAGDYKFENEVRVVAPFVELTPRSLFCERLHDPQSGLKLRHYANHPDLHIRNILRTDSMVMLGPAVREQENLSFVLKQRLANVGLVGTKICVSDIAYRS